MSTIRRRTDSYEVQIRRAGHSITKTFKTRDDAQRWSRMEERRIDLGDALPAEAPSLSSIIERYGVEVAPHQRREENCVRLLAVMLREPWMKLPAHTTPAAKLAHYRDRRLADCATETVRREMGLFQTILRYARREWSIPVSEPLLQVRKPPAGRHRDRRLDPEETQRLIAALEPGFRDFVLFAIETGLRRGELTRVEAKHVDWARGLLEVPETKNGHPRTIPLTGRALDILRNHSSGRAGPVFPWSPRAIQMRWFRAARRLGLEDLHFHDLRHEAVSRFFEAGLSVPEVALISGHRDPRMLFRYTHLRPEEVAKKLRALQPLTSDTAVSALVEAPGQHLRSPKHEVLLQSASLRKTQ
jgi:integrase